MGLDGVELILHVEESFGISITDEQAGDIRTAGALVRTLLRENYGRLAEERRAWNEHEVRATVMAVIVEELGVRPEEVTSGARFIEDLGVG